MVRSCAAYSCTERFVKGGTVSFHSFPTDLQRRNLWVIATKRENFSPSKYSHLCSKHFEKECFNSIRFGNSRVLKADAVPTIFDFPAVPKNKVSKRIHTNVASIIQSKYKLEDVAAQDISSESSVDSMSQASPIEFVAVENTPFESAVNSTSQAISTEDISVKDEPLKSTVDAISHTSSIEFVAVNSTPFESTINSTSPVSDIKPTSLKLSSDFSGSDIDVQSSAVLVLPPAAAATSISTEMTKNSRFGNSIRLKIEEDAVPTIADVPTHVHKRAPKRKNTDLARIIHCKCKLMSSKDDEHVGSTADPISQASQIEYVAVENAPFESTDDLTSQALDVEATSTKLSIDLANVDQFEGDNADEFSPILKVSPTAVTTSTSAEMTNKRPARFWNPRFVGDCKDFSSPEKAERNFEIAKHQLQMKANQLKVMQQSNRRLKAKVDSLKSLTEQLQQRLLKSESSKNIGTDVLPESAMKILKSLQDDSCKQKYASELYDFAFTLNLHSQKAYDYVRRTFNNRLPHPSTLTNKL